jgi:hypothetical protein
MGDRLMKKTELANDHPKIENFVDIKEVVL